MHDMEMGLSDISELEWPSFLYPRGTTYDISDDQDGLFRGYLLPIVCLGSIYVHIINRVSLGVSSDLYRPKDGDAAGTREKGSCQQVAHAQSNRDKCAHDCIYLRHGEFDIFVVVMS
jgi:hypothetical protein